ncbi:right-handed parallel beta-helix repeat-containing protein [Rhodopseudomonas telluris]|uniref:Right-handed parallel beta-helix repeat-containing protein n=1 Tax=Rhodopseudomonas telluris TaxID=644215 RepID=A0ABV6EVZ2_9BRAD
MIANHAGPSASHPALFAIVLGLTLALQPPATTSAATSGTVLDVHAFGARGDGSTDDTAAFQAAVDRAAEIRGTVRVPTGRYLVGSIELPSHIAIEGEGDTSVLTLRPQPLAHEGRSPLRPGHMFLPKAMNAVASVEDVRISRLTLLGNSRAQNAGRPMPLSGAIHGIAILGGKGWVVDQVRAEDFDGDGIYLGANTVYPGAIDIGNGKLRWPHGQSPDGQPMAVGNLIENNTVRGNLRNGMMIAHGDGNVLRNNLFERNQIGIVCEPRPVKGEPCSNPDAYPKYSPAVYESAEIDLEPNRIKIRQGEPVIWQQVTNTLIEGNTFRNGPRMAIQIVKGDAEISGNRILRNSFVDNATGGILIFAPGAARNIIADNEFSWTDATYQPWILRIHGGNGNQIVGNRFRGEQPAGGRVVQLEPGTRLRTTRCTIFSDNVIDVAAPPSAALISVDSTLEDTVVTGNQFLRGGTIDIAPASLASDASACRQ